MLDKSLIQAFEDETTISHELCCSFLRLDLLHRVVSGNKLFKLKYYLEEALSNDKRGIVTVGGPHSNHLVASAYAAKQSKLESIGLVRGEEPARMSETLIDCLTYGMELKFTSREIFDATTIDMMQGQYPDHLVIQQGGYGKAGMLGAMDILKIKGTEEFDYILAACGSGTTGAGLIRAAHPNQKVVLISVLKNNFSILDEINALVESPEKNHPDFDVLFDFHLGGYAKKNTTLFKIMNSFHSTHQIPTDFVYTGKLVHGFYQLAKASFFPKKSKILLIHSGGLQGNRSLTNNELIY